MNTIQYIDAVKARYNWESDYKLAKEMQVSRARISNYRNGKQGMDESMCLKVASLLKINPAAVLIDITAERTKDAKAAKILHKTAKQLTGAAASIFITIVALNASLYPTNSEPSYISILPNTVYYVK